MRVITQNSLEIREPALGLMWSAYLQGRTKPSEEMRENLQNPLNPHWSLRYRPTTVLENELSGENALKAHHGIGEWREDYDELLYDKFYASYKNTSERLQVKVINYNKTPCSTF